jgi:hypothetical protein
MINSNLDGYVEKRISDRHKKLSQSLYFKQSVSILKISETRAEQIGSYRLLKNVNLKEEILINEIKSRCTLVCKDKVVLCIHDTSEANMFNHSNRLQANTGLGPIDASGKKGIGYKIHDSIVLDAKSFCPYGYSNIKIWDRDPTRNSRDWDNRNLPISEKESNKWMEGCKESNITLKDAKHVIHIQDREGDIYDQIELFHENKKIDYIIRTRFDRETETKLLVSDHLKKAKVLGSYKMEITADSHSKRKKRTATMQVRVVSVEIMRPKRAMKTLSSSTKRVNVIETKEINAPEGIEPLSWTLMTSLEVVHVDDAIQVIEWYSARWAIEEVYRILKKENYDIESSELETGWALRKLAIIAMDTSMKYFQMLFCREAIEEGETLETISNFSESELECLSHLCKDYEGNTEKQKNPFKENTIQWVIWIISRIGGWKGYKSQRKPGATTIMNGLSEFYKIYRGWVIGKDVCTR